MDLINKMEKYAKNNYVPIIRKDNLDYLINIIKENNYTNILEIGSAIGYSAISMARVAENILITTIERDADMIQLAKNNISISKAKNRITLIEGDALEIQLNDKYDLIFIDGAKGQYINFFNKYKNNLNVNGVIISDNLQLLDLQRLTNSKRSKRLVEKMNDYKKFLIELKEYQTEFLNIGDGFAITKLIK